MSTTRGREEARRSSSNSMRSDAISPKSRAHSTNRKRTASEPESSARQLQRLPDHHVEVVGGVACKPFVSPQLPVRQYCYSRSSTASNSEWESILRNKCPTTIEVWRPGNYYRKPRDSRYGSLLAVETVKWDCAKLRSDSEVADLPDFESGMRRPSQAEGCTEVTGPKGARRSLVDVLDSPSDHHEKLSAHQRSEQRISASFDSRSHYTQYGSVSTVSTTKFPLDSEGTHKVVDADPSLVPPVETMLEIQHEQHRRLGSPVLKNGACKYCIQEQRFLQQCLQDQRRSEDLTIQRDAERRQHVHTRLRLERLIRRWEKRGPSRLATSLWLVINAVLVCSIAVSAYMAVLWQSVGPAVISTLVFYAWLGFNYATHRVWGYWHALWLGVRPNTKDMLASDPERQPLARANSKKQKKERKGHMRQGNGGERTVLRQCALISEV